MKGGKDVFQSGGRTEKAQVQPERSGGVHWDFRKFNERQDERANAVYAAGDQDDSKSV